MTSSTNVHDSPPLLFSFCCSKPSETHNLFWSSTSWWCSCFSFWFTVVLSPSLPLYPSWWGSEKERERVNQHHQTQLFSDVDIIYKREIHVLMCASLYYILSFLHHFRWCDWISLFILNMRDMICWVLWRWCRKQQFFILLFLSIRKKRWTLLFSCFSFMWNFIFLFLEKRKKSPLIRKDLGCELPLLSPYFFFFSQK